MAVYISPSGEGSLTARISGEIDHHSARWLRMDIDTALNDNHPNHLVLDFSAVTFMDSSGVGLVMGRYKFMKELGGTVELSGMPPYIEKVMTLAGMDKLVKMSEQNGQKEHGEDSSITEKGKEEKHG